MEVIVERCAFLDVHRDTVMACARTPDGHGRSPRGSDRVRHDDLAAVGAGGLAGRAAGDAGGDGSDRRLLEAGALGARGVGRRGVGDQRPAHAQRAGPQDRRRGRGVGGVAARARPGPAELHPTRAVPGAAGPDPLPQVGDRGTGPGVPAAPQGPRRRRREAVRRWRRAC